MEKKGVQELRIEVRSWSALPLILLYAGVAIRGIHPGSRMAI
jgi:hypothetical protein